MTSRKELHNKLMSTAKFGKIRGDGNQIKTIPSTSLLFFLLFFFLYLSFSLHFPSHSLTFSHSLSSLSYSFLFSSNLLFIYIAMKLYLMFFQHFWCSHPKFFPQNLEEVWKSLISLFNLREFWKIIRVPT